MNGPLVILGPGKLGRSLAQWAAECGLEVRLLGRSLEHAQAALPPIGRRLDRAVSRGRVTPEQQTEAFRRISAGVLAPDALEGAATLLEALPEDPTVKTEAWARIAKWPIPEVLLLSGTSSLAISQLAQDAGLVGRLVGFHLFLPVESMPLVELAVPAHTQASWVDRARQLGSLLQKRVIPVKDQPGFAAARMALAQGLEAMRLLEAGVASAEDLDALMTLGYGHPMGPLELSDRIGLDLRLSIARGLVASGEARFAPPPLLESMVQAGHRGRASGRGFHHWPDTRSSE